MTEGVIEGPSEPESGRDAPAGDPADIDGGMTPSHGESAPAVDASAEEEGKST